jgi:hypothetical protein
MGKRNDAVNQADNRHAPAAKEGGGLFGRLFGRNTDSHTAAKTTLDLADIQGFILRGYRMPMVRHFLLTVGVPAEARKMLGRLVSGNESDAPQITTAEDWHIGFEPGPAEHGPACLHWKSGIAFRRSRSSHSVRLSPVPPNGRNWSAIPGRVTRSTGSADLAPEAITSWLRSMP